MIHVEIPMKINSEANNRDHWTKKLKRKRALWGMISLYLSEKTFPLPCKVTLTRMGKRTLDEDNLAYAFKGVRDAVSKIIIEASNLPSDTIYRPMGYHDSDPRIKWSYDQKKGPYAFLITIEEISCLEKNQSPNLKA